MIQRYFPDKVDIDGDEFFGMVLGAERVLGSWRLGVAGF
jgi:hypothetical protein